MLCQPLRGQDAGPDPRLCAGAAHWRTGGSHSPLPGMPRERGRPSGDCSHCPAPLGGSCCSEGVARSGGRGRQGKAQGQRKGPGLLPGGSVLETRAPSLGREDPLEEAMATHSSVLAWRIPWTEEPGGLQSTGVAESRKRLSTHAQGH